MTAAAVRAALVCFGAFAGEALTQVQLDVPFVRQEDNGCGSAVIAMILQYWAPRHPDAGFQPADAGAIHRQLYRPEAEGITAGDMRRYFEQQGFHAFALAGDWREVRAHLARGRPVIASLKIASRGPLHFVVVAGETDGAVLVNDPADRKLRKMKRSAFERGWKAAGRWMLLAVPR